MSRNPIPVRERLIATASRLFYEQGYNATGINQILKESGVAKASMYDHFRSKEDICIAYLQQMDEQFVYSIERFIAERPGGKQRIMAIFDFLEEFYNAENFRGCWCLNTIAEIPQDDVRIKTEIRKQKETLRQMIRNTVNENLKEVTNPSLGDQLYLIYEGALVESYLHASQWPIDLVKNMAAKLMS